ncbi:hypothetical protein DM02DRAFT_534895 [Periconia macrospinosa]|uniref:RING-type E3 ubiquitin transferase n=1 Tax=Periconia macrospinosa TaxID=97972 RepID=A0A2V1DEP6_9PLEO|nr:hypothetical protein DM02DRAFT_534895 [Periconia macrospinosa]
METTQDSKHDHESHDTCVICLSPITERAITVPCNHYTFDFICLVSWLQHRSACPLCKTEITAVQYDWASPTEFKTYAIRRTHPPQHDVHSSSTIHSRHSLPPRRSRRPYEQPVVDTNVLRRRHVYRHKLYSYHVGSNPVSGYRDVTPSMIASSPELQSKARMWVRRELRVFSYLYTDSQETPSQGATTSSNAEFLLSYIVAIMKKVDLKASNGHAEDLLQEYLGRPNTRLFLHELNAWMRSPYTRPRDWDLNTQYAEILPEHFDDSGFPVP